MKTIKGALNNQFKVYFDYRLDVDTKNIIGVTMRIDLLNEMLKSLMKIYVE